MEYLIITALQILGILLQAMWKIHELDKKFVDDTLQDVINTFLRNDRITLMISGLVLLFNLLAHYILEEYTDLHTSIKYYDLIGFGIAFTLGYAGQRIIYKYLGKAENVLMKKADKLDNV